MLRTLTLLAGATIAAGQMFPPEHPNVEVMSYFPSNSLGKLPLNEVATVVVGFINNDDRPMNVSGVRGSVHSPLDYSLQFRNFTGTPIYEVVPANQESAYSTLFQVPLPEAMDVQLTFTLFYTDASGRFYSNTFFNETVSYVATGSGAVTSAATRHAPAALTALCVAALAWMVLRLTPFAKVYREWTKGQGKKAAAEGAAEGSAQAAAKGKKGK